LQFKDSAFLLKHVAKGSWLIIHDLVTHALDVLKRSIVTPFPDFSIFEQSLLFVNEGLLLLDEANFEFLPLLEDLLEAVSFKEVVLHVAAKELLEKLTLLRYEVTSASDHLGQPSVHLVLVLAPGHAI
jgi:hypothetical protein